MRRNGERNSGYRYVQVHLCQTAIICNNPGASVCPCQICGMSLYYSVNSNPVPEASCNAAWVLSDWNKWVTSYSCIRAQFVSAVNTAVSIVGMLHHVLKQQQHADWRVTSVFKSFQADRHIIYAKHSSVITTTVLQLFLNLPVWVFRQHHKVTCCWAATSACLLLWAPALCCASWCKWLLTFSFQQGCSWITYPLGPCVCRYLQTAISLQLRWLCSHVSPP